MAEKRPSNAYCAGIIPGSFSDQRAAQRLAMCNDIGEAAYVDSLVAAALLDAIARLPSGPAIRRRLSERYGVPWAPSLTSARPRLCTGWFGLM